jgi:dTDP-4-amino-4,6-dideoxygalactose transaminase
VTLVNASELTWQVPLSDLEVDDEIVGAVAEAVRSGWWSMGPRVEAFEKAFGEYVGSRHALAVANGTLALQMALLAAGCKSGDDIVLPSLNFVAAANAVIHSGGRPIFCDISGNGSLNMSVEDVEAALTPATRAIIALHYAGMPCEIGQLRELADDRGVVLIEDAAHAPGGRHEGRMCGTIGAVGCFSFFSNKNLPVGEGGMVVTDDDELARRLRLLRSHGMTTLTWARHQGHAASYEVVAHGFNARLDEIRAAIGLVGLGRLDERNRSRRRIVALYREAFDGAHGEAMAFSGFDDSSSAHHLAVLVLADPSMRDAVREELASRGVQTSLHYPPIHTFSAFADTSPRPLPVTEDLAARILTLPLFAHMNDGQVELVTETTGAALRRLHRPRRSPVPSRAD